MVMDIVTVTTSPSTSCVGGERVVASTWGKRTHSGVVHHPSRQQGVGAGVHRQPQRHLCAGVMPTSFSLFVFFLFWNRGHIYVFLLVYCTS